MRLRIWSIIVVAFFQGLSGEAADRPLPPYEAAQHMTLPQGFRATLFAGEPDVVQPISFTFDDRGRLWVVECYSYPQWHRGTVGKDRILIFEDPDGTGHFTSRKVFWDKGTNLSGIQLGFGGVWLCATPNLLFIPRRDGEDVPAGPPEVVLDGWDLEAKHNVFNSLTWGPDGWLYGCNGITSDSKVAKPGTPANERMAINCGVWRYHPTKKILETVANGTTNPWGLDFDDYGQMFITNCVIHHLWHVVPGAHFQRMFGQDFNPHLYRLMESCADHIHWGGGPWQESRGGKGVHDQPGGGHAHVGAMVYLGDNWPSRYRHSLFTCNLHGSRINNDTLERRGSGYVAHHAKDFMLANDPWFRGLAIHFGPDGGVFVSDWTDTGECHNYDRVDRTNGRIYKITYKQTAPFKEDLAKLSDEDLVRRQLYANDWHVRLARRILHERAAAGRLDPATHPALLKILSDHPTVTAKLRALWALHVTGGLDYALLLRLLDHDNEYLRGWAVQLALEDRQPAPKLADKLSAMAQRDQSPFLRLYLASALQRLAVDQRWSIAYGLVEHAEDVADANLPLMIWYGIEPLALADQERFAGLVARAKIPMLREFGARRLASAPAGLDVAVRFLDRVNDSVIQADFLRGMYTALLGRRHVPMPKDWPAAFRKVERHSDTDAREKAMLLAVVFGDAQAVASLRKIVTDGSASASMRQSALQALVYQKNSDLVPVLQQLLGDRVLRRPALRALAAFADDATPRLILSRYPQFTEEEKSDAIQTMAARPAYARALLEALEQGTILRRDLTAFTVRQIQALKDRQLNEMLERVWGTIRPASQEKAALMAKYKGLLTPQYMKTADRSHGRAVFARTCASCHVLFDQGTKIGPELTGSQRSNLDYILENVLDPSAVVPQDYQVTIFYTKDGRVISGIVKQETEQVVTVQTQNESIPLPKNEIEQRTKSKLSMMPEGLLDKLSHEEVRDLIAYLASPTQVPLPPERKSTTPQGK
jgi:putative membrane-bound dehydrogenase-like protein